MYDLTRSESFYNLSEWLSEVRANSDPDVVIYLVGNRHDLESEEREISEEDGAKFCK
jgi:Rab family protein